MHLRCAEVTALSYSAARAETVAGRAEAESTVHWTASAGVD
ncbi:MAG: hypothetical protein ACR2RV_26470 [Verrucomicrobiales bacterium]